MSAPSLSTAFEFRILPQVPDADVSAALVVKLKTLCSEVPPPTS